MKHYAPFFTALVLLLALPGTLLAQQWNVTGALNTARDAHFHCLDIGSCSHTFTLSRTGAVSNPVTVAIK